MKSLHGWRHTPTTRQRKQRLSFASQFGQRRRQRLEDKIRKQTDLDCREIRTMITESDTLTYESNTNYTNTPKAKTRFAESITVESHVSLEDRVSPIMIRTEHMRRLHCVFLMVYIFYFVCLPKHFSVYRYQRKHGGNLNSEALLKV